MNEYNKKYLQNYFYFLENKNINLSDNDKKYISKYLYLYQPKEFESWYLKFFYISKNEEKIRSTMNVSDLITILNFQQKILAMLFEFIREFELAIKTKAISYLTKLKDNNDLIKKIIKEINFEEHTKVTNDFLFFYSISFGEFILCLEKLNNKNKNDLANIFIRRSEWDLFDSILNSFKELRNTVAHNNQIIGRKLCLTKDETKFINLVKFLKTKNIYIKETKINAIKTLDIICLVDLEINKIYSKNIVYLLQQQNIFEEALKNILIENIE